MFLIWKFLYIYVPPRESNLPFENAHCAFGDDFLAQVSCPVRAAGSGKPSVSANPEVPHRDISPSSVSIPFQGRASGPVRHADLLLWRPEAVWSEKSKRPGSITALALTCLFIEQENWRLPAFLQGRSICMQEGGPWR